LLRRWIAGQLGRGNCRTLTDALQFLRSCPRENDPLEFIFGDLAREFSEHEAIILSILTYFGLPARAKHISEITGLKEEATCTALRSLANRPLVVPDQKEETFALVPVVGEFLRKIRPELVATAGERLYERAYLLVIENGDEKYDRFTAIEEAWPIVAAALPLFVAGPNAGLQNICGAIYSFLNFTGRWDELRSLNQQAESKALANADGHNAGLRAYHAGLVHHPRREAAAVLACADRAARHWQHPSAGSRGPGLVAHLRGCGRRIEGNCEAAVNLFREGLQHARSISEVNRDAAIFLADLGDAELSSGDPTAAERDLREALRISLLVGDNQVTAGSLIRLARAVFESGNPFDAETLCREALQLSEKIGRQEFIADSCDVLAKILLQIGKKDEALHCAKKAIDLYHRLDSPKSETAARTLRACEDGAIS
jgi:tetratricopeptide (TPR) repeat protein